MGYKTTDDLMQHLRDSGIDIKGSTQKQQLINTGYFHGYKGYRFFRNAQRRLPFVSYSSYNNAPVSATTEQKKKMQQCKLNLQNTIQSSLAYAYKKNNTKITHFYNNVGYSDVPVWALFEIMTMGEFGYLLSCLKYDVRDYISRRLGFNVSCDTNRELIYKYIYTLKDLRNAVAHNAVVFDTRFRNIDPDGAMKKCLQIDIGLPYINFKTIGDYIILMCYYMKLLKVPDIENKEFISENEKITKKYKDAVNSNVAATVIHPDLAARMNILKNFL